MKLKHYFFGGNTPIKNGNNIQFHGTATRGADVNPSDVFAEIEKAKSREFGVKCIFVSFNLIGESEVFGETKDTNDSLKELNLVGGAEM